MKRPFAIEVTRRHGGSEGTGASAHTGFHLAGEHGCTPCAPARVIDASTSRSRITAIAVLLLPGLLAAADPPVMPGLPPSPRAEPLSPQAGEVAAADPQARTAALLEERLREFDRRIAALQSRFGDRVPAVDARLRRVLPSNDITAADNDRDFHTQLVCIHNLLCQRADHRVVQSASPLSGKCLAGELEKHPLPAGLRCGCFRPHGYDPLLSPTRKRTHRFTVNDSPTAFENSSMTCLTDFFSSRM